MQICASRRVSIYIKKRKNNTEVKRLTGVPDQISLQLRNVFLARTVPAATWYLDSMLAQVSPGWLIYVEEQVPVGGGAEVVLVPPPGGLGVQLPPQYQDE